MITHEHNKPIERGPSTSQGSQPEAAHDLFGGATLPINADLSFGIVTIPLDGKQIAADLLVAADLTPAILVECEHVISTNPTDPITRGYAAQIREIASRFADQAGSLAADLDTENGNGELRPELRTSALEMLSWGAVIARHAGGPEHLDVAGRLELAALKFSQNLAA